MYIVIEFPQICRTDSFVRLLVAQTRRPALKLEAWYAVTVYHCTWNHIPEDLNFYTHSYENVKCSIDEFLLLVVSSVFISFVVLNTLFELQVVSPECRSYLCLVTINPLYSNIYPQDSVPVNPPPSKLLVWEFHLNSFVWYRHFT